MIYIYRIVRNFAEDCNRCEVSLEFGNININELNNSKKEVAKAMITVLRDDNMKQILEQRCEVNTLLKLRFQEIVEILKNNKTVILRIRRYYETVFWHIQRLYRIRNEIAHSALHSDNKITILTEHLYDYLSVLISEIVYVYTENDIKEIDMIFPYLKDNYDVFNGIVDLKGNLLIDDFILEDGIINYIVDKSI